MVLDKILENPMDCKEIKPVNPKGNQLWVFIGRTDAEVEAPVHWPPDAKSRLTGKHLDARKYWRQKEKKMRRSDSLMDSMDMSLSKLQEIVKDREPGRLQRLGLQRVGQDLMTEEQQQQICRDSWNSSLVDSPFLQMVKLASQRFY